MPITVDIVPTTNVITMYGSHETGSSYSLSGQVLLSVIPTRSSFSSSAARQPALLSSLTITFEGKQEHYARGSGYVVRRLCRTSQALVVPASPVAVPSTPDHKLAIVFDLNIPGWLPASLKSKHSTTVETSYALYATATYTSDESSLFSSKNKTAHAQAVPIVVKRHRTTQAPKPCTYILAPFVKADTPRLPANVTNSIRCGLGIQSHVDIAGSPKFDIKLEMGSSLPGVSVHRFTVKVAQKCTYFTTPDPNCTLPLPTAQPPHVPLLSTHELDALFACGITFPPDLARLDKENITDSNHAHTFLMREGNQGHKLEMNPSAISVPVHLDSAVALPDYTSPYLDISHAIQVEFDIAYAGVEDTVMIKVPLAFVESHVQGNGKQANGEAASTLPAYIQLFHSNGEARYVAGLPQYSKERLPGEIVDTTGAHPVEFQRRALQSRAARVA